METIKEDLNAPLRLTIEQIKFYEINGFIRIKDIFSPQLLEYYRTHVDRAVEQAKKSPIIDDEQLNKDQNDSTYAKAFEQSINLWTINDACKELAFSTRLASIASQLMHCSGVRIYHDQALYKPPSSGFTPWHCDQFYWPLDSDKTVTAWIPLVPVTISMGPLEFAAQSHTKDLGRSLPIGKASDCAISRAVHEGGYDVHGGGYDLGEVSFHAGWTFHRADANSSSEIRKVYTVIYMDKDVRAAEPKSDNELADYTRYLDGIKYGKVCDGPLTPIVL